jgi:hypothetical protein
VSSLHTGGREKEGEREKSAKRGLKSKSHSTRSVITDNLQMQTEAGEEKGGGWDGSDKQSTAQCAKMDIHAYIHLWILYCAAMNITSAMAGE